MKNDTTKSVATKKSQVAKKTKEKKEEAKTTINKIEQQPSLNTPTNKPIKKNKGGRPPAFTSPEQLQMLIDNYIEDCKKRRVLLTISGLANALDVDRQTILNYSEKDEYFGTINKYRTIIQQQLEEELYSRTRKNVTGILFGLKNNYGWKDAYDFKQNITSKTIMIDVTNHETSDTEPVNELENDVIDV